MQPSLPMQEHSTQSQSASYSPPSCSIVAKYNAAHSSGSVFHRPPRETRASIRTADFGFNAIVTGRSSHELHELHESTQIIRVIGDCSFSAYAVTNEAS